MAERQFRAVSVVLDKGGVSYVQVTSVTTACCEDRARAIIQRHLEREYRLATLKSIEMITKEEG